MSLSPALVGFSDDHRKYGFRIPVFADGSANFYLQESSPLTNLITAFRHLKVEDSDLTQLESQIIARVGQPPVYVFEGIDGIRAGTLSELDPYVKQTKVFVNSVSSQLEIAELYKISEDVRRYRNLALHGVQGDRDKKGYYSLWKSMLLEGVLTALIEGAVQAEARNRLQELIRPALLSADFENPAIVSDEVWLEIAPLIEFDRESFRVRVTRDLPDMFAAPNEIFAIAFAEANLKLKEEVAARVLEIRRMPRQEQRLSAVLSDVFRQPEMGLALVKDYNDRAMLAQYGIKAVRQNLDQVNGDEKIVFFQWLIEATIRNCVAFNKGELLYHLAIQLGDIGPLASVIWHSTQASYAMDVMRLKDRIEAVLRERSPTLFEEKPGTQGTLF